MNRQRIFLSTALFTLFVFADQLSKYIVRQTGGFYICNSGISFGLQLPLGIFYLAWFTIILGLLFALFRNNFGAPGSLGLVLILSGAIGNIIDRLYFGCVVDFIDLKFWPASIVIRSIAGWPIFNLADICISTGSFLLIWHILSKKTPPA
jgi:signal peptidase II